MTAAEGAPTVLPKHRLYVGTVYLSSLVLLVAGIQATLPGTTG
jgi:hypothetical protein